MSATQHSIFNFPKDIIIDILSRIPTKSLLHFRCVCTSSPPLIAHPSFTNLHLSSPAVADDHRILLYFESTDRFISLRSPSTFQETRKLQVPYKPLHGYLRYVGSDKGVICFLDTNDSSNVGTVVLWNPSIKKLKIIDEPANINVNDEFSHIVVGFGFVSRTCEFKAVKIGYHHLDASKVNNTVLVYSLSTNSWKKKEDVCAPCCLLTYCSSRNVFVNGFVNWLALKKEAVTGELHVIMAFDLDGEQFRVFELPMNVIPDYSELSIDTYGEKSLCLALCAHYFEDICERWDVWVMGDYGVLDSWKKVCAASLGMLSFPPLFVRNDREVLIVTEDGILMLLNTITNGMVYLGTRGLPETFRAIRYTASLALLHG